MKRHLLLAYQILTGLSDTATGLMLIFAPSVTLHIMRLHVAPDTLPFLSYIGAFVLSVGLACLYGASLTRQLVAVEKLEVVWLLTALNRAAVATFVIAKVLSRSMEPAWATVAITDGLFALVQFIGLWRGWLRRV